MRLPLWVLRWMHRRRLSRTKLRGTWLHSWFGDRLLDRALWKPTRESLARGWLIGFPITMVPFLPIQSLLACLVALFFRGNLLLCIALQMLSNPLTAPIHLPACYFIGEIVRGRPPTDVWHEVTTAPRDILSGDSVTSLYLGAIIIGVAGGLLGYAVIHGTWRKRILPGAASLRSSRRVDSPGQGCESKLTCESSCSLRPPSADLALTVASCETEGRSAYPPRGARQDGDRALPEPRLPEARGSIVASESIGDRPV